MRPYFLCRVAVLLIALLPCALACASGVKNAKTTLIIEGQVTDVAGRHLKEILSGPSSEIVPALRTFSHDEGYILTGDGDVYLLKRSYRVATEMPEATIDEYALALRDINSLLTATLRRKTDEGKSVDSYLAKDFAHELTENQRALSKQGALLVSRDLTPQQRTHLFAVLTQLYLDNLQESALRALAVIQRNADAGLGFGEEEAFGYLVTPPAIRGRRFVPIENSHPDSQTGEPSESLLKSSLPCYTLGEAATRLNQSANRSKDNSPAMVTTLEVDPELQAKRVTLINEEVRSVEEIGQSIAALYGLRAVRSDKKLRLTRFVLHLRPNPALILTEIQRSLPAPLTRALRWKALSGVVSDTPESVALWARARDEAEKRMTELPKNALNQLDALTRPAMLHRMKGVKEIPVRAVGIEDQSRFSLYALTEFLQELKTLLTPPPFIAKFNDSCISLRRDIDPFGKSVGVMDITEFDKEIGKPGRLYISFSGAEITDVITE